MKGRIEVNIKRNAMEATVMIRSGSEDPVTVERINEELQKKEIKAGIDQNAIRDIILQEIYNRQCKVAEGKPAIRGSDGYYEFFFDRDIEERTPTIRDDGSVDYSLNIIMVNEGDLLAEYHPPTPGNFGYTVLATVVAPKEAKRGAPVTCKNVERRGDKFYATQNGRVFLRRNILEVRNCLEIKGNAGYDMGTIVFNGDVYVKGDVATDVTIEADGNITVDGVVEGARLVARRDIVVRKGIHGMEKAYIQAGGTVTSNFIEEAEVKCGGNIMIGNMINCKAVSGSTICASGRNGQLIGGKIVAGECIEASLIGNEAQNRTDLRITSNDEAKQERARIIVRRQVFRGTMMELNGAKLKNVEAFQGEYHSNGGEVKRYDIGAYHPQEKKNTKPLILIVDDDTVLLRTEYAYLNGTYLVAAVSKPEDALRFLVNRVPDLILMDYMMPNINGAQLLQAIRSIPDGRCTNVPVFFVTGINDEKVMEECMNLYPQGYLLKPLEKEELLKIVSEFFEQNPNDEGI
jgi:hypothetical protein